VAEAFEERRQIYQRIAADLLAYRIKAISIDHLFSMKRALLTHSEEAQPG